MLGEVLGGRPDEASADPGQEPAEPGAPTPAEPGEPGAATPAEPVVPDTGPVPPAALDLTADETADDTAAAQADGTGRADGPAGAGAGPVVPDQLLVSAVVLAQEAALEEGGRTVGEHLGASAEGDALVVTHAFACTDPAYVGWTWAVTLVRAPEREVVTVDEVVLLPGAGALLAPEWVPYAERVRPGDLGDGDLLPPEPDDPRLVASGYDPEWLFDDLVWELGLGRARVLSAEGRADAADRWLDGDTGPGSARAKAAPGQCGDCGFLVPLAGSLRSAFGVCANALAPDDGRVVALAHGCGAHSEQPVGPSHAPAPMRTEEPEEYEVVAHAPRGAEDPSGTPAADGADDADGTDRTDGTADAGSGAAGDAGDAGAAPADPLPGPAEEEQAEELGHS